MLHLFYVSNCFYAEKYCFQAGKYLNNEFIVASESSFLLAQQHRLVRHALRGHPTHFAPREVVLRGQEPNPQPP